MLNRISNTTVKTASVITCIAYITAIVLAFLTTATGILLPWLLYLAVILCAASAVSAAAALVLWCINSVVNHFRKGGKEFL